MSKNAKQIHAPTPKQIDSGKVEISKAASTGLLRKLCQIIVPSDHEIEYLNALDELIPTWRDDNLTLEAAMHLVQIRLALKGSTSAYKVIMERAYGTPDQSVAVSGIEQPTLATPIVFLSRGLAPVDGEDKEDASV